MKITKLMAMALLSAVAFTGCNTLKSFKKQPSVQEGSGNIVTTQSGKTENVGNINKLLYGEWTAMNVGGEAVRGDERPYIVFDTIASDPGLAKFYASNGCNIINGIVSITAKGQMTKASDYLSTMKYCPEAVYEVGVSMVLDNIGSYKIEKIGNEYMLYLNSKDKKQTMVLRRSDLSWLNGAWRVSRLGDVVLDEDAGLKMVIDIPEGKLHGNTGCNIMNGTVKCNPDIQHSISFGNISTTRMACPDMAREQEFVNALSRVASANASDGTDHADLRDARGTLLMELTRIQLSDLE